MRVSANTGKSKNPKIFTESLDSLIFLDFFDLNGFFGIFLVESKKNLGNVWILLMSLVKIIIFSSFLGFGVKSKNSPEKFDVCSCRWSESLYSP